MKNWKTSVGGLLSVIGVILPQFGVMPQVADAIAIVGIAILGYFAKDK